MFDLNIIIAKNISAILKQQNKKQVDLANALHTNKQTVHKMLNGSRIINATELKQISEYLAVKMEDLMKISRDTTNTDIVQAFMGIVESEEAKEALRIADKLSDMIIFHKKVRENGTAMIDLWEEK